MEESILRMAETPILFDKTDAVAIYEYSHKLINHSLHGLFGEGASPARRAFLMGNALVTGIVERIGKVLLTRYNF